MLDRRPEASLAPLCATRGVALLPYGVLAGGFLTDAWLGAADPGDARALENRSLTKCASAESARRGFLLVHPVEERECAPRILPRLAREVAPRVSSLSRRVLLVFDASENWKKVAQIKRERRREKQNVHASARYKLVIDERPGGWARFQRLLRALRGVADRHSAAVGAAAGSVTIAHIALAWIFTRPAVGAAIVGARSPRHVASSLGALSLALTARDLAEIDTADLQEDAEGAEDDEGADTPPAASSAAAAARRATESLGDVYAMERATEGNHGAIMRYNLGAYGTSVHRREMCARVAALAARAASASAALPAAPSSPAAAPPPPPGQCPAEAQLLTDREV